MNCPHCGTRVRGIAAAGPSDHRVTPCECRVTTTTVRDLAGGVDRGRGVATDGGSNYGSTEQQILKKAVPGQNLEINNDRRWTVLSEEDFVLATENFLQPEDDAVVFLQKLNEKTFAQVRPHDGYLSLEMETGGEPVEHVEDVTPDWKVIETSETDDEPEIRTDGGVATVEDGYGTSAPAEVDGVDLKHDDCPVCDCDTFEEFPAGHYHCDDCGCEWTGDPTDASLTTYFGPSPSDLAEAGESLPIDTDGRCEACMVNERTDDSRFCAGCADELLATDGGTDLATHEARVQDDGTSIVYGPWDEDVGEWMLGLSTEDGGRVRLLFGKSAMYELWTEVHNTPWPRKPEPCGTLTREIVEKVNGMDEDQLREVLDTVEAVTGGERQ